MVTTTATLTNPVNTIYQTRMLRVASYYCTHFIGTYPGVVSSHNGSFTVTWRRFDELTPTTTALTPLTGALSLPTRTEIAVAVTDNTATLSKYGQHVIINEEADLSNYDGSIDGIVTSLAHQAGRSLNRLQRNIEEDNTTLIYAGGVSADTDVQSKITADLIENATNTMEVNGARMFSPGTNGSENVGTLPVRESYWMICHTHVKADVRKLPGFISVEKYGGAVPGIQPGEFGSVGDVRCLATQEASIDANVGGAVNGTRSTGGSLNDLYTCLIFGQEAYAAVSLDTELIKDVYMSGDNVPGIILVSSARGSSGVSDSLDEVRKLGWKAWHTGDVLNTGWCRGLRVACGTLS